MQFFYFQRFIVIASLPIGQAGLPAGRQAGSPTAFRRRRGNLKGKTLRFFPPNKLADPPIFLGGRFTRNDERSSDPGL